MAALKFDLDIGSAYNFSLLVSAVLGVGYSSAILAGVFDYNSAIQLSDVTAKHNAALPQLPVGTPKDPKSLLYLKLITTTGAVVVIAQDWIATTPVLIQATQATIVVSNISTNDIVTLGDILRANGFTSFTITQ